MFLSANIIVLSAGKLGGAERGQAERRSLAPDHGSHSGSNAVLFGPLASSRQTPAAGLHPPLSQG